MAPTGIYSRLKALYTGEKGMQASPLCKIMQVMAIMDNPANHLYNLQTRKPPHLAPPLLSPCWYYTPRRKLSNL